VRVCTIAPRGESSARLRAHALLARLVEAALVAAIVGAWAAGASAQPPSSVEPRVTDAPVRVLFVGNSLTEANALPQIVEALAAAAGRALDVTAATHPGASLADQWTRGTPELVRRGGWTWVVLQQGPSALPQSRVDLRASAARFAALAREHGAEPALYMVWPSRVRAGDFARVSESYRLAAADVRARLLPVGDAWRAAWRAAPGLRLYGPDEFHPSRAGTYLAAIVITAGLTGSSPDALPCEVSLPGGDRASTTAAECAVFKRAAADALSARD
jgi:hypothetical protein